MKRLMLLTGILVFLLFSCSDPRPSDNHTYGEMFSGATERQEGFQTGA